MRLLDVRRNCRFYFSQWLNGAIDCDLGNVARRSPVNLHQKPNTTPGPNDGRQNLASARQPIVSACTPAFISEVFGQEGLPLSAKNLFICRTRCLSVVALALLLPLFGSACTYKADQVMIDLGPLNEKEASTLLKGVKGEPLQIGIGRQVPADQQAIRLDTLDWQIDDKARSAAIKVRSTGATSLRLGLRLENPNGCQDLHLSFQDDASLTAISATGLSDKSVWWSPVLTGDIGQIHLQLPVNQKPSDCTILLTQISHIV